MKSYAFAKKNLSSNELTYVNTIFDDEGELIYASSGVIGFGDFIDGAAIAAHRLISHMKANNFPECKLYTNCKELVDALASNVIQTELIQELKKLNPDLYWPLQNSPEIDFTKQIFIKGLTFDTSVMI